MNRKIASSIIVALIIVGSTSYTAIAAMSNGTVVIGNKAFDLGYANDSTNAAEISNSIVNGGAIYVKDFDGIWINNTTDEHVLANIIPSVVYKSSAGGSNFDAADGNNMAVISVQSVSIINTIKAVYGTTIGNVALPAKVTLKLSNNTTRDVNVTWTSPAYDETKTASYMFSGAYVLPVDVTGERPPTTVNVVVGVNPDLTDTTAAKSVDTKIAALPALGSLTLGNKIDVVSARAAYTSITVAQKTLVTKLTTLIAAESQIVVLQSKVDEKVAEDAAEIAVKAAENSRMNVDVIRANKIIQAVKNFSVKTGFSDRIANINVLNEVVTKGNNTYVLTNYNTSINDFITQEMINNPAASIDGQWRYAAIKNGKLGYNLNASQSNSTWVSSPTEYNYIKGQLINNIDPVNLENDPVKVYEFVVLNYIDCITANELNSIFGDNNVLSGKGQVFIDAAKASNVNPIYLAAHAILETGRGTSMLANGGTKKITGEYTYGVPVYNLFGIGAIDGDADSAGTIKAYTNGWTNIDLAIYGGAAFIAKGYIVSDQNTLYKMRWNPLDVHHQYATDTNWANSQIKAIKECFDLFPDTKLDFDIPVFNK